MLLKKVRKKTSKKFVGLKKTPTFATAIERESNERKLNGALVQLVRIHACHAWGHGFESRTHRKKILVHFESGFFISYKWKNKKTGTCRTWHIPVNRVNAYSNTS